MLTYNTLCHLKLEACHQLRNFSLLHSGDCVEGASNLPLMCERIAAYEQPADSESCRPPTPVAVNKCSGGCGKVTGQCCEPSAYRYDAVRFSCPDGRPDKVASVLVIEECACLKGTSKLQLPPVV